MNIKLFHTLIFEWFKKHGRILPWRMKQEFEDLGVREETIASYFSKMWDRNPYHVVISELMLQQTQVDRVLPKFEAFLKAFPTVHDLSNAKLSEVLILWKGLGYNRRAIFLHKMAQTIVKDFDGVFPKKEEELLKLPGVGGYTARAILAFGYGQDVGVIDTNIKRIYSRAFFGDEFQNLDVSKKEFEQVVDESVPKGMGDPWNQSLMDFGALICTASSPKCDTCPIQTICKANVRAKEFGFLSYADQLKAKKPKENKKREKVLFKNTDRYFRGKIIDILREHPVHMKDLQKIMVDTYMLADLKRFGQIIETLMVDGLIVIKGSIVALP